ncbi:MAG: GDSL-type esterase/lipase family protein [Nitrobacter sp.]|jgi:acyl-CoA thioesterase-1
MTSRPVLLLLIAGLLAFVACADDATAQIVAIGASNVAGRGVSSAEAWPPQLEDMLAAKGRHVHVANAGINGDTNAGMLNRLDSAVPAGTKIVLLDRYGGGWNGRRLGRGSQTAELASIEARLRSRHITVIPMCGVSRCVAISSPTTFISPSKATGWLPLTWWGPSCGRFSSARRDHAVMSATIPFGAVPVPFSVCCLIIC